HEWLPGPSVLHFHVLGTRLMPVVHQLVPTFVRGDATGQAALHFQLLLRGLGFYGEIFAGEVAPELRSVVAPARVARVKCSDWVLYHHGIASELTGRLLHLPCHRGVIFHNITPARIYAKSPLEEPLVSGRAQLAAMARHVELGIGVSGLNCAELCANG